MTGQPNEVGRGGKFAGNQVVVDIADLRPILTELGVLKIDTKAIDTIPVLRVAMITLDEFAMPAADSGPAPLSDLDALMTTLRAAFERKFLRQPRMGKNRDMEIVEGLPQWASAGLPKPIGAVPMKPRSATGGPGLRVGVLDTAMFPNDALDGRWLGDELATDTSPLPTWAGHSTFIVGRILMRAPDAVVEVRRVLEDRFGTATLWAVAEGMASFLGSGVDVLNLSLGCFTADDEAPFLLERAAQRLCEEMVVVAAVGNHGKWLYPIAIPGNGPDGLPLWRPDARTTSSPMWPAAIDGVVGVGSAHVGKVGSNFRMTPADFTPVDVPWIELWAPGVDVPSTYLTGPAATTTWQKDGDTPPVPTERHWNFTGYATWSGTSMSAGDVTGEIAAVAQAANISAQEARRRIGERPGGFEAPHDVRPWIGERVETGEGDGWLNASAQAGTGAWWRSGWDG